jgi:hypothetical protein
MDCHTHGLSGHAIKISAQSIGLILCPIGFSGCPISFSREKKNKDALKLEFELTLAIHAYLACTYNAQFNNVSNTYICSATHTM